MTAMRFLTRSLAILPMILLPGACDGTAPLEPDGVAGLADRQAAVLQESRALPFHGSTSGMLVGMMGAPEGRCPAERPILLLYQGKGTATHLGQFTVVGSECASPFDPADPTTLMTLNTGEGRYTLTAANGDLLTMGYDRCTLAFEPPPSPWLLWSTSPRALSGTGRFVSAELVDVTWGGGANLLTYETYSTIDGWIRYTASDRSGR